METESPKKEKRKRKSECSDEKPRKKKNKQQEQLATVPQLYTNDITHVDGVDGSQKRTEKQKEKNNRQTFLQKWKQGMQRMKWMMGKWKRQWRWSREEELKLKIRKRN